MSGNGRQGPNHWHSASSGSSPQNGQPTPPGYGAGSSNSYGRPPHVHQLSNPQHAQQRYAVGTSTSGSGSTASMAPVGGGVVGGTSGGGAGGGTGGGGYGQGNLSPRSMHPASSYGQQQPATGMSGLYGEQRSSSGMSDNLYGGFTGNQSHILDSNAFQGGFNYNQQSQGTHQSVPPHHVTGHQQLYQQSSVATPPMASSSQQQQQHGYNAQWVDPAATQPHLAQAHGGPSAYGYGQPPQPMYKTDDYMRQHYPAQMVNMMPQEPQQQQQQQQGLKVHQKAPVKDEDDDDLDGDDDGEGGAAGGRKGKDKKSTSDFVKKLFRMLDDTSYSTIVSWGPAGDSFIVKDMNDFTKHVLPRHFRHSNFASFVRQLNKYDFHKVKKPEDQGQLPQVGVEQLWEFRHPAFMQHREDLLEQVKRKVPASKKSAKGNLDGGASPREQSPTMPGTVDAAEKGAEDYAKLKEQVASLTVSQEQMTSHMNNLTKQYQSVIGEMMTFQKNMVQQDQLMQNLIQYLMNLEADRQLQNKAGGSAALQGNQHAQIEHHAPSRPALENGNAFVSAGETSKIVTSYSEAAKGSFAQMSAMSQAINPDSSSHQPGSTRYAVSDAPLSPKSTAGGTVVGDAADGREPSPDKGKGRASSSIADAGDDAVFFHPPHLDADAENKGGTSELFNAAASAVGNPSLAGFEGAGLRVFTVGTLQPRSSSEATGLASDGSTAAGAALEAALLRGGSGDVGGSDSKSPGISVPNLEQLPENMPKVDKRTTSMAPTPATAGGPVDGAPEKKVSTPSEGGLNMLRVRRSTYVPGWAVPPRVLVVDDDDTCRKIGSKFLQVFGCAIDVAVDGVSAVNKMNLEQYDLVLMDIVMPNLDGVSATSLIREFDPRTPIISMTSNSAPNELLSYMSSGMNDVLPKPFTKEGLLKMLEKHLIHLKTVQKMDEIPKALGLPPVSDEQLKNVLTATAHSATSLSMASAGGASSPGGASFGPSPLAAVMGNGPEAARRASTFGSPVQRLSQAELSDTGRREAVPAMSPTFSGSDEDDGVVNPLAGMGFSDEEYISMLQNLIAAGAVSDTGRRTSGEANTAADTVANVMGVARGEGVALGKGSKESTPVGNGAFLGTSTTRKRSAAEPDQQADGKRSRITELQA